MRARRLSVALIVAGAVLGGCGSDPAPRVAPPGAAGGAGPTSAPSSPSAPSARAASSSASAPSLSASALPDSGAAGSSAPPNGVDLLFAKMMVVHHDQAVRMSRELTAKAGVPERAHAVAAYIAQDQQREIDEMNAWLRAWGKPAVNPADPALHRLHGRDAAAHGMVDETQLTAAGAAGPAEATRLYLRHMIEHHNGAITMARSALADGQNAYIRQLSRHIVNEQSAENDAMRTLLTELR